MKIKLPSDQSKYDLDKLLSTDVPDALPIAVRTGEEDAVPITTVGPPTVGTPTADRTKYIDEWKKEHKDRVKFYLPKGDKDFLKAEASKRGLSLTAMIEEAIKEYLENHPL